mmetsp:Transcript_15684/g.50542  ORF Transcript_15684/g.50542 Transcript_15684/m.50542 type:complete len:207 (-) Transcript_15684:820-1440(-)
MDAFLPGGQLERPLSWLGRARLPAHLRVLTATTPAAVLSPPRATRIRSRTACNRRAAPLPSIVGAGIEDPCAICPEICGVTRLEPYVATRRGGGRLAEGSSSHISWCVHCTVWFLYLHRCRSRGPAVQGATGSGRTRSAGGCTKRLGAAGTRGTTVRLELGPNTPLITPFSALQCPGGAENGRCCQRATTSRRSSRGGRELGGSSF